LLLLLSLLLLFVVVFAVVVVVVVLILFLPFLLLLLQSMASAEAKESKAGSGTRLKPSSLLTQLPPQLAPKVSRSTSLPSLTTSASAPALNAKSLSAITVPMEMIYGKRWTSEHKRYLHQRRERRWLQMKAKYCYIDFSVSERAELRRYFDELAGSGGTVGSEQLENMLISLGLAENRRAVSAIVETIDDLKSGELDFEQFLEMLRKKKDANILKVFKEMTEGKLGDPNLNFQTVISMYRRQSMLDAAGCGNWELGSKEQELGSKVLYNFAALQRSRHADSLGGHSDPEADTLGIGRPQAPPPPSGKPTFEITGHAPLGGMEMVWRGICHEHNLVSSRPTSAAGRSRRTVDKPPSPREVIASIVKIPGRKRVGGTKGTVMLQAPALEEEFHGARRLSKEAFPGSRRSSDGY